MTNRRFWKHYDPFFTTKEVGRGSGQGLAIARSMQGLKAGLYTRRKDWDMHFADGGAKAIELMQKFHFDVLVTDLRMPGLDGTTLVARARAESPGTIRVVLSGYADERQSQSLVSLAHRYLSKPCEPKLLEECIDRCLATQALIESPELRIRLGAVGALPPMPNTFSALQRALADPSIDLSKVSAIIEKDPAVSAKVLEVCNSAFFRLPRRVSTIKQAVSYLGLSTVRSMVLSAEVFRPGKPLSPGLDLGQMQQVLEASADGRPLAEAEQEYVGVRHGVAGGYLLGLWGLQYEVVEAVAHHEVPTGVEHSSFGVLGAVAIAQTLLLTINPREVPAFEAQTPMLDNDYLRKIGFAHSWDSLVERATTLLGGEEAA